MGNFILNLSHHMELLRVILKKEALFHSDEQINQSFQDIKALILKSAETPLRYYYWSQSVTVQTDASQRGLGVCAMQDDRLIAFANKSLTDAEKRYANVERERELLATVFAPIYWEEAS